MCSVSSYLHLVNLNILILIFYVFNLVLRILAGKKHRQIILQHLQKVRTWAFESLIHQINSIQENLKLKQNFQKNKIVAKKIPSFVISPFCTHHSICLNIGFWYGSFVWKWCVFNRSAFNLKNGNPVFWKRFLFFKNLLQS